MDSRCQERANVIEQWIQELEKTEETLLNLEYSEDAVFANIYLSTTGTVEERKAKTNSHSTMTKLREAIAIAKKEFNKTKRMYELSVKAGDWEYGTLKVEESQVRRQRGA